MLWNSHCAPAIKRLKERPERARIFVTSVTAPARSTTSPVPIAKAPEKSSTELAEVDEARRAWDPNPRASRAPFDKGAGSDEASTSRSPLVKGAGGISIHAINRH